MSFQVPERPALRRHFHMETVAGDVFLMGEDWREVVPSGPFSRVLQLADGTRTAEDIVLALADSLSPPEVYYVLAHLARSGWIGEADTAAPHGRAAFWHAAGREPKEAEGKLAAASVRIQGIGASAEPLCAELSRLGVGLDEEGRDLTVVVTDNYLRPEVRAVGNASFAAKKPWMALCLARRVMWIGPLFLPGTTGCYQCLADRLIHNHQVEDYVARKKGYDSLRAAPPSALPSVERFGAAAAALQIVRFLGAGDDRLAGALLSFDTTELESSRHVLVKRPQCALCGDPARFAEPSSIVLTPVKKRFTSDGGHRSVRPDETLRRFEHLVSPITGVVSWLANTTAKTRGLAYSFSAGHNFAMGPDTIYWLRKSLRCRTGGKGMTEAQAKASAIGEAVERYSGVHRGDEPRVTGSYRSLGERAIHLYECLHFSERQYQAREALNAGGTAGPYQIIPNRFDEDAVMDWTPVWSLTEERTRLLPAAFCYYGHPDSVRHFFCSGDTNGCASGNTVEEAILQGFLEIVERDAVALWWYSRARRPALDLDSFEMPYVRRLRDYYAEISRSLWVLDITTDLGVPAFAAVSHRLDRKVEDVIFGFGAHLDPRIALLRSLTELNQFLPAVLDQGPDGQTVYAWPDDDAVKWWKNETIATQPYVVPDSGAAPRKATSFRSLASDDLATDVRACVDIARSAGMEMLALDQTRPDVGMSVCRVIVPGMRHFWRRLAPGRLYDVPRKLGWVDSTVREEDLNPIAVFI